MPGVEECDGRCCELIQLAGMPALKGSTGINGRPGDRELIIGMLAPVGPDIEGTLRYVCLNFDQESRKCKIYESRPEMCYDYPYLSKCEYCGGEFPEEIKEQIRRERGL